MKVFLKKKKKKSDNMVVNNTKMYQKIKKKSWLNLEKNMKKIEKSPCYNYKKLFSFRKFCFFLRAM